MQKRFLIIDGLNLIRRLYAALEKEMDPVRRIERTQSTSIDALSRLLHQFDPDYAVVVFDSNSQTWRHRAFPEYKLGRIPMDDILLNAMPEFAKLFRFNKVPALRLSGWEADDLIATLAFKAAQNDIKSYIISTDKGFTQLLGDTNILQYDYFARLGYDKEWVYEKYGVSAEMLGDYWALVGDTTNKIPGVKGIGPKTAVKVLAQANTVEAIYQNLDTFEPKMKQMLEGGLEQCKLSRSLALLKTDVEIGVKLSQLKYVKQ
ncbi:5'-3' exonuclease [Marinomonas sp. S3726]|uniref:flap endonuclease Xni n=1 Tax=Marinomonas sp. S3726 TaxID=579484 RepID=UPI0005FA7062|nr:flap endonuclease Xni [Marinomonas sp. S3726]KJZ10354.1 5'-3' exonuclease [Marinomonas sp. S3726]